MKFSFPGRFWETIIGNGVTADTTLADRKRVRLLNGICFITAIIYLSYLLPFLWMDFTVNIDTPLKYETVVSSAGLLFAVIPLLLNHSGKYSFSYHFFNVTNIVLYLTMGIIEGGKTAVEYIFIPSSIASMLFFRNPRTVIIYFALNSICFAFVKYYQLTNPILFELKEAQSLFVTNLATVFVVLFLIVFYYKSENSKQENLLLARNISLGEEKHRSDLLLSNILPVETAEELKATGEAKPKRFDLVTVLFADIKDFTKITESMGPEELVNEINNYYKEFDRIIASHGIEKIKTIGDGYMAQGVFP